MSMFRWLKNRVFKGTTTKGKNRRASSARRALQGSLRLEPLEERAMMAMLASVNLPTVSTASDVLVADVNGDSHADILSLHSGSGKIGVHLNNGDDTYQAPIYSLSGGSGAKMVSADFDHDGKLDLATMQGAYIDLLHGNGDGSFQNPIPYYASAYPNDIDVGDVNHDGFDDIFTASFSYGGTTQLFLNDGMGSFHPSRNLSIGPTGLQIDGADVDGDGNLDLVQSSGSGYVAVLVGHGDGTFVSAAGQSISTSTSDLRSEDIDGDGRSDMIVTSGNVVSVYLGTPSATFVPAGSYAMPGASRLQVGDINGDGHRDVVANNGQVLLGRSGGGFYAASAYGTATGAPVALGDLNDDGSIDVVAGASTGGVNLTLNAHNDIELLAGATHLAVSTTGVATAGTPLAVTVTALDDDGNIVTGFLGSVGIAGAPGTMPVSYTFTAADNGVHEVANAATWFSAGTSSYSVTAPFLPDVSGSVTVVAGAPARFQVAAPTTAQAGTAAHVTVGAYDAYGNFASNYVGTVHLTSNDAQADLPADYTFSADDAGTHAFDVIYKTAGSQSVSVTDTLKPTSKSTSGLTSVTPAAAASLDVVGGGGFVGSVNAVRITARDAFGNVATGFNGIVHLESSDPSSVTSADAPLAAGTGTFTVTPMTLGQQTLTASSVADATVAGSEVINVTPGWGARFVITPLPSTTAAGQAQSTLLTIYDAYGNISTVFNGWVQVSSSDSRASALVYVSPSDAGVKTIPVTLYTAGVQSVTISDYYNPNVTVTQIGIRVTPGEAVSLAATPLVSTTAGQVQQVSVSGRDAYGNVAPTYRGTVNFSSTDSQAVLPTDYTFSEADAGEHTFDVTLKTAGGQDLTIVDTADPLSMQFYQHDVFVFADVLSTFTFKSSSTSNTTAGSYFDVTVSATDAYGNPIEDYSGTVHFSSTDAQAGLPADYTFTSADLGEHVFSVSLRTVGSQSVSVADNANRGLNGSSSSVNVRPAAASKLAVSTSATATSGTSQKVTVTATDAYGNVADSYGGTVGLTSSDAQATLPAAYTFGKKDGGSHTFDVTLRTVGTQSVSASDSLNSSIAGSQTGIQVSPSLAAVASFGVTGFPATVAGTAKNFTVTAKDASGSVVSGYTGTVRFSSSDQQAGLPASYTFTAADAGSHVFSATLKTAGSQSITVVDSVNATAVGSQTGISVTAAAAAQFVISAPASTKQGSGFKVTLTVYDNYGNLATGYTGKVTLTSTDPKAGSTSYTFSTKDAGAHLFSYTLGTVGLQTLTFTDSLNSSLTGKVTVNVTAK